MWPMTRERQSEGRYDAWRERAADVRDAAVRARFFFALVAVALVAFVLRGLVTHSPLFALKAIEVSRCEHVTSDEIHRFLELYPRQSLFAVELTPIRERLLDHPWVADARVRRVWPDTVSIEITERRPVATILISADEDAAVRAEGRIRKHMNLYFVDDRGVVFSPVPVGDHRRLPVLTGFSRKDFVAARSPDTPVRRISEAVELLGQARLDWDDDLPPIQEIAYDGARGFSILVDRTRVVVGPAPFQDVFFRLETVLRHLGPRWTDVTRIDLSLPDRAVVKGLREEKPS
ncbi:MAG: FtsQ-type POTRA domain-containing protein [Deltaproteobacteria bacterium]|nr:FtsQ-type POTRA domain-containing protein [Deltaproteobacteria bacterium]